MSRFLSGAQPIALLAVGFAAWSALFLLLYAAQAVGCRLAWDRVEAIGSLSVQRSVQVGLFLVGLACLALLHRWLHDQSAHTASQPVTSFLTRVSAHCGLAALGSAVFTFAGALWLTAC